jgi:hypothetical protein
MSLVKCKVCTKEVAIGAATCPHCGIAHPGVNVDNSGCIGVMVMLGLILVFYFIFSPSDTKTESSPAASPEQTEASMIPTPEEQAKVKAYIESNGLWCGKVTRFREKPFSSSVNKPVFRAACDDGTNAQNYEIILDRAGNFVTITED